jgi:hypothetical protein
MSEQISDHIVHLGGELACRYEDQCPRAAGARLHGADDEWNPEGERLARPGRRPAADVPPCECRGDRLRLNGEWLGDALPREAVGIGRGDAKV